MFGLKRALRSVLTNVTSELLTGTSFLEGSDTVHLLLSSYLDEYLVNARIRIVFGLLLCFLSALILFYYDFNLD